jgi:uracil-DNA glycosylase family 4
MADRFSPQLQEKLASRLHYYQDLGIREFFRDRAAAALQDSESVAPDSRPAEAVRDRVTASFASAQDMKQNAPSVSPVLSPTSQPISLLFPPKIGDGTLQTIREDIGDCIRCKLHRGRTKIVFGDGHPQAKLLFIGEGPGRDEDLQGLPFVGRAGKLLTQMIEAMGLKRSDVYICNVVKCRPPENRAPEKDEVAACSPFLFRQIDLVAPQVIVCLGSIAAQTILETTRGISQFRGQWLEFRGRKLMATYHPAYLLRNPAAKSEVWKDLQKVMAELGLEVKKTKPAQA